MPPRASTVAPPRSYEEFATRLRKNPDPTARDAAAAAVQLVEDAIVALGPVATRGTTHPARLPSDAQRLAALTAAVEQAHVRISLRYFLRYARAVDQYEPAACSLGADASWR
jgi:hypothetical protein